MKQEVIKLQDIKQLQNKDSIKNELLLLIQMGKIKTYEVNVK